MLQGKGITNYRMMSYVKLDCSKHFVKCATPIPFAIFRPGYLEAIGEFRSHCCTLGWRGIDHIRDDNDPTCKRASANYSRSGVITNWKSPVNDFVFHHRHLCCCHLGVLHRYSHRNSQRADSVRVVCLFGLGLSIFRCLYRLLLTKPIWHPYGRQCHRFSSHLPQHSSSTSAFLQKELLRQVSPRGQELFMTCKQIFMVNWPV